MGQEGQGDDPGAEQVERGAFVADPALDRIVDDLDRIDLPGRVLRAAFLGHHRAGRISRAVEGGVAVLALGPVGGEAAAVGEHEQHVLDDSVAKGVGEDDAVGISDVAARIDDPDIAFGADLVGGPVPGHPLGAQPVALAVHAHVAARRHDLRLAVVAELVRAEGDLAGVGRRSRGGVVGSRRTVVLRQRRAGSGEQQRQRGQADEIELLHFPRRQSTRDLPRLSHRKGGAAMAQGWSVREFSTAVTLN